MGIQFPPAFAFLFLLYFYIYIYIYFFFVRISRMHVATLHTSLHARRRCENEAHIREIGRVKQAWERKGAQLFAR